MNFVNRKVLALAITLALCLLSAGNTHAGFFDDITNTASNEDVTAAAIGNSRFAIDLFPQTVMVNVFKKCI